MYRREIVEFAPVTAPPFQGGYGTAAVAVGPASVLFTRPSGGTTGPLTLLDTVSGRTETVRRFPGLLRAGVVDDTGAWLLGTYGLARVSLPELALVRTLRRGVPNEGAYLHDLGAGVLAVSRIKGATLMLIHTDDGDRVRRLRLPPAEQLMPSAEGWWLYSAEEGAAVLLDRETLKVRRRGVLPSGRFSVATDDAVFVCAGPRTPAFGELTDTLYLVSPERIMWVNRDSLEVEASSLEIPGLQRPIGVDPAGVVHVEVSRGVVALDAVTLAILGQSAYSVARWASWHPGLRAVVIVEQRRQHERVHLFRWQPEA